ncbi:MAG TPA: hypothetical protein VFK86_03700 [Bauldia sp.]|nr:hypothetical protein [Bauldia sp.]
MDAIVSGSFGRPSAKPRRYDLYIREGATAGLVWRYRDEGVVLTPLGLEWTASLTKRVVAYAEIRSIRVQTGHIPRSGFFGTCIITFRDGLTLTVNSLNSWGSPDEDRLDDYAEFLHDLHARLSEADRRRIHFYAGVTEERQMFGKAAIILGGAFFVVLPLVLLVATGEMKALFITLTGAAFIYPAYRTMKKNEPRTYDPTRLDDDLFPHT